MGNRKNIGALIKGLQLEEKFERFPIFASNFVFELINLGNGNKNFERKDFVLKIKFNDEPLEWVGNFRCKQGECNYGQFVEYLESRIIEGNLKEICF